MDIFSRKGDTFERYSELFQIELMLIRESNLDLNGDELSDGARVSIPGFVGTEYLVQPSDTLSKIAESLNYTVDILLLANPQLDSNEPVEGQTILLPSRVTARVVQTRHHYDYRRMMFDLKILQELYPFLSLYSIGKTVLEKEMPEVVIGVGSRNVHFNASFHANEWITTPVIMTFLNDYCLSLTNSAPMRGVKGLDLYKLTTLSIVPMVNPDGVDLVLNGPPPLAPWNERVITLNGGSSDFTHWKANIRGVDLNDQFPAKWEWERAKSPGEPGPRDYGGEQPLTEPEAIAMAALAQRKNFDMVLAFHTQCEEIYWGFDHLEPPESWGIVEEFARVSGYKPVKTIESYAGFKDWFIQEWKRPGFTVELGYGINPLPISQFEEIYRKSLGIFLAGLYM